METTPARVHPADVLRTGAIGLTTRRVRTALSALGIAIGIASMVAVLGLSESSRSDLLATLDRLGTNLLRVEPGQELFSGDQAVLPDEALDMIAAIDDVQQVSGISRVEGVTVRRNELVPETETNGIRVAAGDDELLRTLGATVADGRYLDAAAWDLPVVVLGYDSARRLGITRVTGDQKVYVGDRWFTVVGILGHAELSEDIDRSALIGYGAAEAYFGSEGDVTTVYVRADPENVDEVSRLLARTTNPVHPEEVSVSRPSDALAARSAAKSAFTSLFLGLGAVALLVGGVGIANVMVISVLERRSEIGLRRALGAMRSHIRWQFVTESVLLAVLGGATGTLLGVGITVAYAAGRGWDALVPPYAVAGGLVASIVIGSIAGAYPAAKAARLPPTEALRST